MGTRRVAGNEVQPPDGQRFSPGVVELDQEGNVVDTYPLVGETARTTWIGGLIEIIEAEDGWLKAYKGKKRI